MYSDPFGYGEAFEAQCRADEALRNAQLEESEYEEWLQNEAYAAEAEAAAQEAGEQAQTAGNT